MGGDVTGVADVVIVSRTVVVREDVKSAARVGDQVDVV